MSKSMSLKEKQQLVRLLHLYMDEIVAKNEANIYKAEKLEKGGGCKWSGDFVSGLKAQYEHARILATRLAVDVGENIKTVWEL